MEFTMDLVRKLGDAGLQLLLQPYFYIGILFLWWKYQKQVQQQRRLFQVKLVSALKMLLRTLGLGIVAGIVGSVVFYFYEFQLSVDALLLLWPVAFLLMLFRLRYLCFAFAGALLIVAHLLVQNVPAPAETWTAVVWIYDTLNTLDVTALVLVIGVAHILEAVLMKFRGTQAATPVMMQSKRGKIIGAYAIQGFWPIPLFLHVDGGFIAFPILIGFAELTRSHLLKAKVSKTSSLLAGYGLLLTALAFVIELVPAAIYVAPLLIVGLHEAINYYGRYLDAMRSPLYTHDNRGLRVLSIVPGSPAEELGIVPGEILSRVNGIRVLTKLQLHEAFRQNSAYCKLEVINLEGELKFLKRAIYEGDLHQLGIILAPDDATTVYVTEGDVPLRGILGKTEGVTRLR